MIKEIKQFFIRTWEKVKQGGRWVKKHWKGLIVSVFGATAMAVTMLPKDTTPSVEVNGVVIEFPYTDDNTDENVLIYTDKETYSNGEYIYMAIKNEGADGTANIQFFFNKSDRQITEVKRLVKNSPYQVEIPEYKTVKYDCSYTLPANATTSMPEQFIKKECEKDEQTGSHSEIRYKDIWADELITDFSKVENDLLISKIKEKPKDEYTALKKAEVELVDSFTYFRAKIKAPMKIDEEFFIEVIGDGLYGHLDPFLSGWDKRIQFDVPPTNIDAALDWFPLMLHIGTSTGVNSADISAVFDEIGNNYLKIAVTDASNNQMYAEVESWATSTEQGWIWASATSTAASSTLSSSATTTFYLYYDNDHADNTTYVGDVGGTAAQSVWNTNYKAVYHLADVSGNGVTFLDSTSNNNDGIGTTTATTTSKVGDAQYLNGTSNFVRAPANASFYDAFDVDWSVEMWTKPSTITAAHKRLFAKPHITHADPYYSIVLEIQYGTSDDKSYDAWIQDTGDSGGYFGEISAGTDSAVVGSWAYLTLTFDLGTALRLYQDDSEVANDTSSNGTYGTNDNGATIGKAHNFNLYYFDGVVDEFRAADRVQNASWVKANYNSMADTLISWGTEESEEVPAVEIVPQIIIFD